MREGQIQRQAQVEASKGQDLERAAEVAEWSATQREWEERCAERETLARAQWVARDGRAARTAAKGSSQCPWRSECEQK
jgi:hypothetical protein